MTIEQRLARGPIWHKGNVEDGDVVVFDWERTDRGNWCFYLSVDDVDDAGVIGTVSSTARPCTFSRLAVPFDRIVAVYRAVNPFEEASGAAPAAGTSGRRRERKG